MHFSALKFPARIIAYNSQKCLQNTENDADHSVLAKRKDRIASCGTAGPYFSGHFRAIGVPNNLLLIILRRAQLRQAIKEMTDIKPNKLKIFLTQIYVYVQAAIRSWQCGIFAYFSYFAPREVAFSADIACTRVENRQQVSLAEKRKPKSGTRLGRKVAAKQQLLAIFHIRQLELRFELN